MLDTLKAALTNSTEMDDGRLLHDPEALALDRLERELEQNDDGTGYRLVPGSALDAAVAALRNVARVYRVGHLRAEALELDAIADRLDPAPTARELAASLVQELEV